MCLCSCWFAFVRTPCDGMGCICGRDLHVLEPHWNRGIGWGVCVGVDLHVWECRSKLNHHETSRYRDGYSQNINCSFFFHVLYFLTSKRRIPYSSYSFLRRSKISISFTYLERFFRPIVYNTLISCEMWDGERRRPNWFDITKRHFEGIKRKLHIVNHFLTTV